jgi:RNA polymerase sigma-70 factor (ECF subfamily)
VLPHESLVVSTAAPVEVCAAATDATKSETIAWLQSILNEFEGPLIRYAARITGDLELARDVVQETFLRVCREDRKAVEGHLARWLFHVCRNRALDVQRKEQRMSVATDLDLHSLPGGAGPAELLAARETSSRLLSLLEVLPANQQEVIRLKFQNDLKYREIADVTGLSIANVGFLLHTGLKRLRELMKEDL